MRCRNLWLLALVAVAACGPVDRAKNKTNLDEPPEPSEVKDAVVEKLHCSGIAREETRNRVQDAVEGKDFEDLAAKPTDVAQIVASTAVTTDTSALLYGNLAAVTSRVYMRSALSNRWETLECSDRHSQTCQDALSDRSGGTLQTSVECENERPQTVRSAFQNDCRLFATANAGAVSVHRDSTLTFDQLVFGSVRRVDGRLGVETQSGDVRRFRVETGEKLTVTSDAGKSCEKKTVLRELSATDRSEETEISFDATRASDDTKVRIQTPDAPVTWQKPVDCSCPLSGSLQVRHSDPVGLGKPGVLRIEYSRAGGERCSRADVEIIDWPEGCGKNDRCGRDTIQELVGELVTASCTGWAPKRPDGE